MKHQIGIQIFISEGNKIKMNENDKKLLLKKKKNI